LNLRIDPNQDRLTEQQLDWLHEQRRLAVADVLTMTTCAASGHPGGSLSTLDALLLIYALAEVRSDDPLWPDRDRILVSHGHISPAVYATLARFGFIDGAEVRALFRAFGSRYGGHVESCVPGVEWNTGNLGQGLSAGVGAAMAARLQGRSFRTIVLCGDGEQQKGQVSEARRMAVKFGLGSLIAVVDVNGLQIGGGTQEVMPQDIAGDWRSGGWEVLEVEDGHDYPQLFEALRTAHARADGDRPTVLLLRTVMGKGFAPMENLAKYHGSALSEELCLQALEELDAGDLLSPARKARAAFEDRVDHPEHPMPTVPPPALDTGEPQDLEADAMADCRGAYGKAMEDLAERNNGNGANKIAAFSCDLEGSVKLSAFRKVSPDAFFECGIQEHGTATTAGRLSREGHSVFFSTFGVFAVTECFNQQRLNDFNRAHLKVVATHCGLDVGMDGPTHQCIDYVGLLRSTMGWEIYVAGDANQCDRIVRAIADRPGCQFLGMGRSKLGVLCDDSGRPYYRGSKGFEPGRADKLHEGADAAIIACGRPVHGALQAAQFLRLQHGLSVQVWNAASLRPFDASMVTEAARTGLILTAEDHHPDTGLGAIVANELVDQELGCRLVRAGVDTFGASGTPEDLYRAFRLDGPGLAERLLEVLPWSAA
jgi:transketolase